MPLSASDPNLMNMPNQSEAAAEQVLHVKGVKIRSGFVAPPGCLLVITDYNPRFEDAAAIRATLLTGAATAVHPAEVHEVPSQAQAIRLAVSLAGPGDTILWVGPGHEDHIDVKGEQLPFSARDEARRAMREAGWA